MRIDSILLLQTMLLSLSCHHSILQGSLQRKKHKLKKGMLKIIVLHSQREFESLSRQVRDSVEMIFLDPLKY